MTALLQLKLNIAVQEDLAKIDLKQQEIYQALKTRSDTPGQKHDWTPNVGDTGARGTPVMDHRASHSAIMPPVEMSMPQFPLPSFPGNQSSNGTFNSSAVRHDQITIDSSHHVLNYNSGNTTTMITKNSNNDSLRGAFRINSSRRPKRRR